MKPHAAVIPQSKHPREPLCADVDLPVFVSLCQKCSWTPVGLGARRPPARLCASSRTWACRAHSWCSAKPVPWNSALPAKPAGTLDKAAQRPCQSPSFQERPGTLCPVTVGGLGRGLGRRTRRKPHLLEWGSRRCDCFWISLFLLSLV